MNEARLNQLQGVECERSCRSARWVGLAVDGLLALLMVLAAWPQMSRPIWSDEAWLLNGAYQRDISSVLGYMLEMVQPASIGFLWLEHGIARIAPGVVFAARLPSLLAAIGSLWIVRRLLRSSSYQAILSGTLTALLATSLFFVRYGSEIKQYMIETLLGLALMLVADRWAEQARRRWGWLWLGLGVCTLMASYVGWFVWLATLIVLAIRFGQADRRPQRLDLMVFGSLLLLLAMVIHFGFNRHISDVPGQLHAMLSASFSSVAAPGSRLESLMGLLWVPFSSFWGHRCVLPGWVSGLLILAGWWVWYRQRPVAAGVMGVLLLLLLLAVGLGKWVIWGRMNLIVGVLMTLCLFQLLGWVVTCWLDPRRWLAGVAILTVGGSIIVKSLLSCQGWNAPPTDRLIQQVDHLAQPGDWLVSDVGVMANLHYGSWQQSYRVWEMPWPFVDSGRDALAAMVRGAGRPVWVLVSLHNREVRQGMEGLQQMTADCGQWVIVWQAEKVAIYRFEPLSSKPVGQSSWPDGWDALVQTKPWGK